MSVSNDSRKLPEKSSNICFEGFGKSFSVYVGSLSSVWCSWLADIINEPFTWIKLRNYIDKNPRVPFKCTVTDAVLSKWSFSLSTTPLVTLSCDMCCLSVVEILVAILSHVFFLIKQSLLLLTQHFFKLCQFNASNFVDGQNICNMMIVRWDLNFNIFYLLCN